MRPEFCFRAMGDANLAIGRIHTNISCSPEGDFRFFGSGGNELGS